MVPRRTSPEAGSVFAPGRRLLTSGLVLIVTLVAFESLAIATVMPLVEDDLGDLQLYGWVFSAFFLGNLIGAVVAGTAADRLPPAVPFAVGLCIFAMGLVIGGLAESMFILVLGRVFQGMGAGAMPAVAYVCIGRGYHPTQRPRMFALISSAWMLPSIIGPTVAAVIGESFGWRWVFLGLLPLCVVIGGLALFAVRQVPTVAEAGEGSRPTSVRRAIAVAAGAGAVLAGLGAGTILSGVVLVAIGLVIGLPAFRRLTPVGTLRARAGLPATVAVRGLLNLAFFAVDAYVPFALTNVRGLSPAFGGLALTSASLTWTAGSWVQARAIARTGPRRLVVLGMSGIALGCAVMLLVLVPWIPAAVGLLAWAIAGFGMGVAYSPLSVVTLGEAEPGREGAASAALQLSDMLGVALGTGVAGVIVASGVSFWASDRPGLALTFVLGAAVASLAAVLARRVPSQRALA